jgi:DNA-binding NarL/FixJ family response regulator
MPNGTVLIVDDDPFVRSVVARILEEAEWDVVGGVENAVDGINLARALRPDVVVLDVSMPGLSGLEAVDDLRAAGSAVVICTGFETLLEPARHTAADAVVDKSDLVSLPDALAQVVAGRHPTA